MRLVFILVIFTLYSCSTSKSVLICGDHECINKEEAKLFFKEKLTLEVKIITKNKATNYNLVKMNLENDNESIKILKSKNRKVVRKLSKDEIKLKKKEIIEKKNMNKKLIKKKDNKKIVSAESVKVQKKIVNKNPLNICSVLEICNIDTISDYLIKQSLKKDYPNIASKD